MCGCLPDFAPGIDMMFCIGRREGRELLDVAVLVRRSSTAECIEPDPAYLRMPPGSTSGGGATVGPFWIQFVFPQNEVRVDGTSLLILPGGHNVALIEERGKALVALQTDAAKNDLGPWPDGTQSFLGRVVDLPDRLRAAVAQSIRVRAFLKSGALRG